MDKYLIHFVRLQRVAEEVNTMFGYGDTDRESHHLSPDRVQISVRTFMANIQEIRKDFSHEVYSIRKYYSLVILQWLTGM
jgi:hypothetical protein